MSVATQISLLWAAFTATHLGLASVRIEPRLRAKLGDGAFLGLYSVVALAIFIPLMRLYFANRHAGAWLWAIEVGAPLRAVLYAIVPGALGAAVWWGVRTYAGYEIGLIAIGIGYFVGLAVMRASGNRGGIPFQLLAVALTYFWITANYVPDIVGEIARADEPVAAQSGQAEVPSGEASATAGGAAIAFVLIVGISLAAPFLQGAENLIGLLIIGFGLWQAWSLNKRNDVAIAGPFDLAASPPAAPGG